MQSLGIYFEAKMTKAMSMISDSQKIQDQHKDYKNILSQK